MTGIPPPTPLQPAASPTGTNIVVPLRFPTATRPVDFSGITRGATAIGRMLALQERADSKEAQRDAEILLGQEETLGADFESILAGLEFREAFHAGENLDPTMDLEPARMLPGGQGEPIPRAPDVVATREGMAEHGRAGTLKSKDSPLVESMRVAAHGFVASDRVSKSLDDLLPQVAIWNSGLEDGTLGGPSLGVQQAITQAITTELQRSPWLTDGSSQNALHAFWTSARDQAAKFRNKAEAQLEQSHAQVMLHEVVPAQGYAALRSGLDSMNEAALDPTVTEAELGATRKRIADKLSSNMTELYVQLVRETGLPLGKDKFGDVIIQMYTTSLNQILSEPSTDEKPVEQWERIENVREALNVFTQTTIGGVKAESHQGFLDMEAKFNAVLTNRPMTKGAIGSRLNGEMTRHQLEQFGNLLEEAREAAGDPFALRQLDAQVEQIIESNDFFHHRRFGKMSASEVELGRRAAFKFWDTIKVVPHNRYAGADTVADKIASDLWLTGSADQAQDQLRSALEEGFLDPIGNDATRIQQMIDQRRNQSLAAIAPDVERLVKEVDRLEQNHGLQPDEANEERDALHSGLVAYRQGYSAEEARLNADETLSESARETAKLQWRQQNREVYLGDVMKRLDQVQSDRDEFQGVMIDLQAQGRTLTPEAEQRATALFGVAARQMISKHAESVHTDNLRKKINTTVTSIEDIAKQDILEAVEVNEELSKMAKAGPERDRLASQLFTSWRERALREEVSGRISRWSKDGSTPADEDKHFREWYEATGRELLVTEKVSTLITEMRRSHPSVINQKIALTQFAQSRDKGTRQVKVFNEGRSLGTEEGMISAAKQLPISSIGAVRQTQIEELADSRGRLNHLLKNRTELLDADEVRAARRQLDRDTSDFIRSFDSNPNISDRDKSVLKLDAITQGRDYIPLSDVVVGKIFVDSREDIGLPELLPINWKLIPESELKPYERQFFKGLRGEDSITEFLEKSDEDKVAILKLIGVPGSLRRLPSGELQHGPLMEQDAVKTWMTGQRNMLQ